MAASKIPSAFPIESIPQNCNNDNQQDEKSGGKITLFSTNNDGYSRPYHKKSDSFTSLNSESLQFCTEGLGSESLDDSEDLKVEVQKKDSSMGDKVHSFRNDGRFVLQEVRIPTQECFRAKREGGRLRLSLVQPDDDDDVDVDVDDDVVVEDEDYVIEDDDGGKEEGEMSGVRKIEEEERGDGEKDDYEIGSKE
ncbi:Protein FANTASTIC FOUR 3 [Bienertia sinuspersici]